MRKHIWCWLPVALGVGIYAVWYVNQELVDYAEPIDAAENAYFQFRLEESDRLFQQVWEDHTATVEDRTTAGLQLARTAAHVRADLNQARNQIALVLSVTDDESLALAKLAQIERENENFEEAIDAAIRAADTAQTNVRRREADLEFARAVLNQALARIRAGEQGNIDRIRLRAAYEKIESILQEQPSLAMPSHVALKLALILENGPGALWAWESYFHIRTDVLTTGILRQPHEALQPILKNWESRDLEAGEKRKLVMALADSRMFEAASLIALRDFESHFSGDKRIGEILAYNEYLAAVEDVTEEFYRDAALEEGDHSKFIADLDDLGAELWPKLQWRGTAPRYSKARFLQEISTRFGAEVKFKKINGFQGVHFGHRVADEEFNVEQYGRSASVRFVGLDFMVSNGYTSWFWDGRAQVGGWADNPKIVQIRSGYADTGINAWMEVNDAETRREIEHEIADNVSSDIALARKSPTAFLPGLAKRIRHRSLLKLYENLKEEGLKGTSLRDAYISEIERAAIESSIIAHEGRHAIDASDATHFLRSSEQKEFRAKLSEVVFSSDPFLALYGGILSKNMGDGTAHGDANERVMEGIIDWMSVHTNEIAGLEPDVPLMPQVYRLSDEQLREAIRSMEPLLGN